METLLLVLHALELLLGRHLRSSRRRRSRHLRGGVGVRNSRRGCLRLEHRRLHLADHLLFHRLARVHELILLVQHHLQCLLRRLDLLDELLDVHVAVALLRLGAEHHHALHAGDKIALVEHGRGEFHHASRLARRLHRERHAACAEVLWGHALAAETVQPGTQTGAGGGEYVSRRRGTVDEDRRDACDRVSGCGRMDGRGASPSAPERARAARAKKCARKRRGELSGLARKAGTTRGGHVAPRGGRARKARMRAFDAFVETCGDRDRTSGATRVRGARRVASRRVPSSGGMARRGRKPTSGGMTRAGAFAATLTSP